MRGGLGKASLSLRLETKERSLLLDDDAELLQTVVGSSSSRLIVV